jgi:hypothetical protein
LSEQSSKFIIVLCPSNLSNWFTSKDPGVLCVLNKEQIVFASHHHQGDWDEGGYTQITTNHEQTIVIEPSFKEITAWLTGSEPDSDLLARAEANRKKVIGKS